MILYALLALNVAISLWGFSVLKKGDGFRRFVFAPFPASCSTTSPMPICGI